MAQHNELGKLGEQLAQKHLQEKGYVVLETNWTFNGLETDIIAQKDDWLVFVEVRTRSNDYFQTPEQSVNIAKQKRLLSAARAYIKRRKWEKSVRMDVIAVVWNENRKEIHHIEDAFQARGRYY